MKIAQKIPFETPVEENVHDPFLRERDYETGPDEYHDIVVTCYDYM